MIVTVNVNISHLLDPICRIARPTCSGNVPFATGSFWTSVGNSGRVRRHVGLDPRVTAESQRGRQRRSEWKSAEPGERGGTWWR